MTEKETMRPVSVKRSLVFLLAAIINGAGIYSGAEVIGEIAATPVLTTECAKHLLSTEEHGMRQLNVECNNEYRILIRRLEAHIAADARIEDMIRRE